MMGSFWASELGGGVVGAGDVKAARFTFFEETAGAAECFAMTSVPGKRGRTA